MNFGKLRLLLWVLVALGSGFLIVQRLLPTAPQSAQIAQPGTSLPIADPYVTLLDSTAQPFDTASLKSGHQLVYFGFTFCPDVCPISARKMVVAEALYKKAALDMPTLTTPATSLFITIDPERDSPEIMGFYAENLIEDVLDDFSKAERTAVKPDLIGLSGDRTQIDAAIATYLVYADKVVEGSAPDDYRFNHSDLIYWVRPNGAVQFFSPRQSAQDIADAMIAASS
ncbi:MAG: SCO family protein [Pseudomonadota bacterium]